MSVTFYLQAFSYSLNVIKLAPANLSDHRRSDYLALDLSYVSKQ